MVGLLPRDHWEYRFSDAIRGLAASFKPRTQPEHLFIPELGNCIPVRSGRAAIVSAIRALKLPAGSRIGVPLYCCNVVFKAIAAAGCTVRFIDIEPETFCVSVEDLKAKSTEIDALVAVHMFGNVCDIPALQAVMNGRPVIEDCAQAIGSKWAGRMVGSFGSVAFFSFRSGKYLSVGEGGALYSKDPELHAKIGEDIARLPAPGWTAEWSHTIKSFLKSMLRSKPLYGLVGYILWDRLNKKLKLSEASGIALSRIYHSDLTIARRRLGDLRSAIEAQRAHADVICRQLDPAIGATCATRADAYSNRYHFPVIFPSPEFRDAIAHYLLKRNIDSIKYIDDIPDIASKHYDYAGDCPTAERLAKRVLIIPSYYTLKPDDLDRISRCVNEGWAELSRSGVNAR